jgi:hypothetical protein
MENLTDAMYAHGLDEEGVTTKYFKNGKPKKGNAKPPVKIEPPDIDLEPPQKAFVEFYDGKVPVKKEPEPPAPPAPPAPVFLSDVQRLMIAISELSMDEMKEICKETNDLMKAIRRKNNFLDAKSKKK